ncbi:MAG: hypothetical protein U0625_02650 [Phycisphaerales bacterium]
MRPDRPRRCHLVAAAAALSVAASAVAQSAAPAPAPAPSSSEPTRVAPADPGRPDPAMTPQRVSSSQPRPATRFDAYEVVDPTVADRNTLGTSFRMFAVDLSPSGFRNVYKVPGHDDLLMRADGGLYAVFEQATYRRAQDKETKQYFTKPTTPASTTYYIGRPNWARMRGTGVRDLSFRRETTQTPIAPSKQLVDMSGVSRLHGVRETAGATRVENTRVDARVAADEPRQRMADEEVSYPPVRRTATAPEGAADASRAPGAPGAADAPRGDAADGVAPRGDASGAADATPRSQRPDFQKRIDQLMRRAAKAP